MYEMIETKFQTIVYYAILVLEAVGVLIILYYSAKSIGFLLKKKHRESKHALTEGTTSGLSFLLGSEVLKTIVAPDWSAIGMTCAILLMRAAVTILVHWENKSENGEL